jgi:hypothetical protein
MPAAIDQVTVIQLIDQAGLVLLAEKKPPRTMPCPWDRFSTASRARHRMGSG